MNRCVWLVVAACALCTASCGNKAADSEKKKLERARSEYLIEHLSKPTSDEFVVLLSIKYNVPLDLTRKILDEFTEKDSLHTLLSMYAAKTVKEFEEVKRNLEKPSIQDRIEKFSTENNVPQSLIASLLVDYNIWYESQRDEGY